MYEQLRTSTHLDTFTGVSPTEPHESNEKVQPGASELLPLNPEGRVFSNTRRVSIDDCDPIGRMEFDAIARFLQDVGNDDTDDGGFGALGLAWVARRALIRVEVPAQAREELTLSTWCSGTGRRWAERRTSITGSLGAKVDAVTTWIHLDPETGRPVPWGDEFATLYLPASKGRRVDARLRLPKAPESNGDSMPWSFRATDSDAYGHVNNAAYLALAEEFLDLGGPRTLEIEWRTPCHAGDELTAIVAPGTGLLHLIDDATSDTRAVISTRTTS